MPRRGPSDSWGSGLCVRRHPLVRIAEIGPRSCPDGGVIPNTRSRQLHEVNRDPALGLGRRGAGGRDRSRRPSTPRGLDQSALSTVPSVRRIVEGRSQLKKQVQTVGKRFSNDPSFRADRYSAETILQGPGRTGPLQSIATRCDLRGQTGLILWYGEKPLLNSYVPN